jgi:hypothetical protein
MDAKSWSCSMLGVLLHAPRGPFYSHKGPRSRWNPIWKALVAFCLWVHRTIRCTGQLMCNGYESSDWSPSFSGGHRTVRWHFPGRCLLTWPTLIARSTVGMGEESLLAWRTGHVRCTSDCPIIFSQQVLAFSPERLVGPADQASPGHVRYTPDYPVVPSLA